VVAFYRWALAYGHVDVDPTSRMVDVKVRKGRPHPTRAEDLRVIFARTGRPLRTAYILAAFAGLRCAEITRLRWEDITLGGEPWALVHGKGGKERRIPLLAPVVAELIGAPRSRGLVVPYVRPNHLSVLSCEHLERIGIATTLHSMRHSFGTETYRATRDPLLVRDLLGHSSVASTEIYMDSTLDGAHERLAALTSNATALLG